MSDEKIISIAEKEQAIKNITIALSSEDTNSIDNPRNIVPVAKKIKAGKNFKVNLPAYSVNVLTF